MTTATLRLVGMIGLALVAFAGNSLLTRAALLDPANEAASFAAVRLLAGAAMLIVIGQAMRLPIRPRAGDLPSIAALAVYAVAFSFAYPSPGAATGALVPFATVQFTMVAVGLLRGNPLRAMQTAGLVLALAGLGWLLAPGVTAPPLAACLLMITAGIGWGVYSVLGQGAGSPIARTARNFIGTVPVALMLLAATEFRLGPQGVILALASGAITSALGYVIWYMVLPQISAFSAANLQLSVPAITAMASVVWLDEVLTLTLISASVLILTGIALTFRR